VPRETAAVLEPVLCTPYNHAPVIRSRMRRVYVGVFSCNLPPVLLTEWQGSFTCCCGEISRSSAKSTGGRLQLSTHTAGIIMIYVGGPDTETSQRRKLTLEKEILPPLPQGLEHYLSITVRHSNRWASPLSASTCCTCFLSTAVQSFQSVVSWISAGSSSGRETGA